ncbi:MAG TPA: hypothetical protein EYF98_11500 [Planctomycetes bacterium]|nr:hypothetical protein [Planctomycetota bacterium]
MTPRIAAWFNRVGYFHGLHPETATSPEIGGWEGNWSGNLAPHGGLYVHPNHAQAVQEARGTADREADYDGTVKLWEVYRVHIMAGDYLAVDEDHWAAMGAHSLDYHPRGRGRWTKRRKLHEWGAGKSIEEYHRATAAQSRQAQESIWDADDRIWAKAFVFHWSRPIINTCVRRRLLPPAELPRLRVWSTPVLRTRDHNSGSLLG